jgi:hypothetical protein
MPLPISKRGLRRRNWMAFRPRMDKGILEFYFPLFEFVMARKTGMLIPPAECIVTCMYHSLRVVEMVIHAT